MDPWQSPDHRHPHYRVTTGAPLRRLAQQPSGSTSSGDSRRRRAIRVRTRFAPITRPARRLAELAFVEGVYTGLASRAHEISRGCSRAAASRTSSATGRPTRTRCAPLSQESITEHTHLVEASGRTCLPTSSSGSATASRARRVAVALRAHVRAHRAIARRWTRASRYPTPRIADRGNFWRAIRYASRCELIRLGTDEFAQRGGARGPREWVRPVAAELGCAELSVSRTRPGERQAAATRRGVAPGIYAQEVVEAVHLSTRRRAGAARRGARRALVACVRGPARPELVTVRRSVTGAWG